MLYFSNPDFSLEITNALYVNKETVYENHFTELLYYLTIKLQHQDTFKSMESSENFNYDETPNFKPWGMELKQFCMLLHLAQLAGFMVPLGGIV